MIPIVFGLGGLIARVAAAAVIPRLVRALARSLESKDPVRPDVRLEVAPLRENPGPPPVAAPVPEPVLGRVLGSEKQCFKACRYTASYPVNSADPSGLDVVVFRSHHVVGPKLKTRVPHAFFGVDEGVEQKDGSFIMHNDNDSGAMETAEKNTPTGALGFTGALGVGVINSPASPEYIKNPNTRAVHRYFTTSDRDAAVSQFISKSKGVSTFQVDSDNCFTCTADALSETNVDPQLKGFLKANADRDQPDAWQNPPGSAKFWYNVLEEYYNRKNYSDAGGS